MHLHTTNLFEQPQEQPDASNQNQPQEIFFSDVEDQTVLQP